MFNFFKTDKNQKTADLEAQVKALQEVITTNVDELKQKDEKIEELRIELSNVNERNFNQSQTIEIMHDELRDIKGSTTLTELLKHSKISIGDLMDDVEQIKDFAQQIGVDLKNQILENAEIPEIWDHLNENNLVDFLKSTDRLEDFLEFFDENDLHDYLGYREVGEVREGKIFYLPD